MTSFNDLPNAADIFRYNPNTGDIWWKDTGEPAGYLTKRGYRLVQYEGRRYRAHRLAWTIYHGKIPADEMDHINGVKDDNRIENLRVVSTQDNQRNSKIHKHNTSGHMGVFYSKRDEVWRARIKVNKKYIYLGSFKNKDDAIGARQVAEEIYGFHENHGKR